MPNRKVPILGGEKRWIFPRPGCPRLSAGTRGNGSDKEEPLIFRPPIPPREGDPAVPFEVNPAVFVFLTPASGSGEKRGRRSSRVETSPEGGFSSQNPAL